MRKKKINTDEELDKLIAEFDEKVKNWKSQPKPKEIIHNNETEIDEFEQDTWEDWE